MTLKVYEDDGSFRTHQIKKETFLDESYKNKVAYIASSKKEENALDIFNSFFNSSKSILFDKNNKALEKKIHALNIKAFKEKKDDNNIFTKENFSFTYFTSGTTGLALGALKTNENILEEVKEIIVLLQNYKIKKVIVTVPFIHFYGSLLGLFYPLIKGIDIILKEHFLPNDLLDLIDEQCLVVTTPLYIKALNRLDIKKDLNKSLFVSSTAPLDKNIAKEFNNKFSCDILHLFGSTETGGIAYKYNDEDLWTKFNTVKISTNKNKELKVKSPFVSSVLYENQFKQTRQEIQTFDYVEIQDNKFKLLGRSSKIFKIAGKRFSTIEIENILEKHEEINKALVFVIASKNSLRAEELEIILESSHEFRNKEIQLLLKEELCNIKFSISLKIVNKINISNVGKKIRS